MDTAHYYKKKVFVVAVLLLVIGGLNLGYMTVFKVDIIRYIFGKNALATNLIFLLIGLSALCIGFYRDTYLPFLGPTVFPCAVLNTQTPENADFEIKVSVEPGVKVLYWAAEPANKDLQFVANWRNAYLDYKNAGVAVANSEGQVVLKVRKPQPYNVPMKGDLTPHIHYRICNGKEWMGPVHTVTFDGKEYFENVASTKEESVEPVEPVEPMMDVPAVVSTVVHDDSISKINSIAEETIKNSRMVESGAFDESLKPRGATLELAFP